MKKYKNDIGFYVVLVLLLLAILLFGLFNRCAMGATEYIVTRTGENAIKSPLIDIGTAQPIGIEDTILIKPLWETKLKANWKAKKDKAQSNGAKIDSVGGYRIMSSEDTLWFYDMYFGHEYWAHWYKVGKSKAVEKYYKRAEKWIESAVKE